MEYEMRKALVVCASVAAILMCAPEASADEVSWGIKGGLVLASLDAQGPEGFETDPDSGAAIGTFVGVALGQRVRLQPEVWFVNRRFSAVEIAPPFGVSSRSLEVPVLVQVRFPDGRRAQAFLCAGPQLTIIGKVTQALAQGESDISDRIKNVDVGVAFGGGLERGLGRGALVIEARVTIGLRDVNAAPEGAMMGRGVLGTIGYRF
jgi:hypothetical protein